jgi:hypothetical protein
MPVNFISKYVADTGKMMAALDDDGLVEIATFLCNQYTTEIKQSASSDAVKESKRQTILMILGYEVEGRMIKNPNSKILERVAFVIRDMTLKS